MGNIFTYKDKAILYTSSCFWDDIHRFLVKIVKEKNINNFELEQFLLDTDQEIYGFGCVGEDLHYYFAKAENRALFASLLDEVVQQGIEEWNFDTVRVDALREFKDVLLTIDR